MSYPNPQTGSPTERPTKASTGFSLIELLTVIAVVSILMATTTSFIPSLMQSNQVDENISTLTGIFEQAREAALSGNTFVYVMFTGQLPTSTGGVAVVVIESQDGTDALNNFAVNSGAINTINDLQVYHKVQALPGVKLTASGAITSSTSPGISRLPSVTPAGASMPALSLTLNSGGTTYTFTQGVMFKPDGEGLVSTSNWNDLVEFGLESNHQTPNVAVMRLTRLTGNLTVYRQ